MKNIINLADIQAEIARITKTKKHGSDGFYTALDLAEMLNRGRGQTSCILKQLNTAGLLEVSRSRVADITGRVNWVPSYKINTPKKKGKK